MNTTETNMSPIGKIFVCIAFDRLASTAEDGPSVRAYLATPSDSLAWAFIKRWKKPAYHVRCYPMPVVVSSFYVA